MGRGKKGKVRMEDEKEEKMKKIGRGRGNVYQGWGEGRGTVGRGGKGKVGRGGKGKVGRGGKGNVGRGGKGKVRGEATINRQQRVLNVL